MTEGLGHEMAQETDIQAARAAKQQIAERLAGRQGVNGVGIGRDPDGSYTVEVMIAHPGAGGLIPDRCQGIVVHTQIAGRLRAG